MNVAAEDCNEEETKRKKRKIYKKKYKIVRRIVQELNTNNQGWRPLLLKQRNCLQ